MTMKKQLCFIVLPKGDFIMNKTGKTLMTAVKPFADDGAK